MKFEQLSNSKVLVTGASGFIGANLTKRLNEIGAQVYGVSRKDQIDTNEIRWSKGDLSELEFVYELFARIKPDYVVHLASHVLGSRDIQYIFSTFRDNLVTTLNILSAVQKFSCKRLVITGSFEEGSSETTLTIPSSPYAAAKIAASNYARMFHNLYNVSVCTTSLYMVYGPGQIDKSKLLPYTILKASKGESPELSSGVRMIDWVFVDDVSEGLLHMLIAEGIEGQNVDIGSGESVSIKEIVDLTVHLIDPSVTPIYGATKDRPMEQEKNADVNDTYAKINWKASVSLKEGLRKTIAYYTQSNEV